MKLTKAEYDALPAHLKPGGKPEIKLIRTAAKQYAQAKVKQKKPFRQDELNKTEKDWLAILERRGFSIVRTQSIKLSLAEKCWYTPDFYTVSEEGEITFWEVKGGFIREDSTVKLKTAAVMYPEFTFIRAQKKNGQWIETKIKP